MIQDIRYAVRMLCKNPGFTLVAVLSLAIGAGANSAMYSLADAMLLRPLPVRHASSVLTVVGRRPKDPFGQMSYRDYLDLRAHSKTMDSMVAVTLYPVAYSASPDVPAQVKYGLLTSGNLFQAMGVTPILGRAFRPDEDQAPGRDAVVVLGYSFWKEQMGADRNIVGRTIRLNAIDFTIIGVAPEEFTGLDQYFKSQMFIPAMMAPRLSPDPKKNLLEDRDNRGFTVKGRLVQGVTRAQAEGELVSLAANLEKAYPTTNRNQSVALRTEVEARIEKSPPDAGLILMLLILAGAVLVVACLNVANLLLSRARSRNREVAVRLAMGAGRLRLVRQLLTESFLLSVAGSIGGLGFGYAGMLFFRTFQLPTDLPFQLKLDLDGRVLAISLGIAVFSVLLFGLAPAIQSSRADLVPSLKASEADSGKRRIWGRNLLVVGQVAISLVLLIVATMLYRGFGRMLSAGPGYRTNHLLLMSFDPSLVHYTDAQTQEFFRRVSERAAQATGVKSVTLASVIPMGQGQNTESIFPEGFVPEPAKTGFDFTLSAVIDDHYFTTMNIPIVSGRGIRVTDTADSPKVAVVNETLAKKYWPGQDAVGKRFRLGDDRGPWVEVVGVAMNGKYLFIAEQPIDFLYFPLAQKPQNRMTLIAESFGDSAGLATPLGEVVRGLDPKLPVYDVRTMENVYENRAINTPNMILETVGAMGLMGLVLAMVGLYGLVAYGVSRRTREFGIRMAIGANSQSVLRMVLGQGMALALAGIAAGLLLSLLAGRGLKAMFYSTSVDLAPYVIVPALLIVVTLAAAYGPARRASRIDPMKALRYE